MTDRKTRFLLAKQLEEARAIRDSLTPRDAPLPTLKACPFCGGEATIERMGDHGKSTIYMCTMCGCTLETGEEWGHGTAWNRRATLEPKVVQDGALHLAEACRIAVKHADRLPPEFHAAVAAAHALIIGKPDAEVAAEEQGLASARGNPK